MQRVRHGARDRSAKVRRIGMQAQQNIGLIDHSDQPLAVHQYRQLRHIGQAHALEGGEQGVVRAGADHPAILKTSGNQVTQIAVMLELQQALVLHPLVVVDLGQITRPGVTHKADHTLGLGLFAAIAQRGGQQGAGGRPAQNAFGSQQLAGVIKAFFIADRVGMTHAGQVADRRDEVFANALHRPGTGFADHAATAVFGHHRAHRVGQNHFQIRLHALKKTGQAGQRTGRPDTHHNGIQIVLGLRPDFRGGAAFVGQRVGRVIELIGEKSIGDVGGQARGHVLVILRVALADVRPGDMHLSAHGLEVQHLLGGHLVRHHQHHPIAFGPTDQRQPQAGVTGRCFNNGAAGAQTPVALGGINHGQADPVLDRASGVLRFKLEEQRTRPGIEPADTHQRRVADQFQNGRLRVAWHDVTSRVFALDGQRLATRYVAPITGNLLGP